MTISIDNSLVFNIQGNIEGLLCFSSKCYQYNYQVPPLPSSAWEEEHNCSVQERDPKILDRSMSTTTHVLCCTPRGGPAQCPSSLQALQGRWAPSAQLFPRLEKRSFLPFGSLSIAAVQKSFCSTRKSTLLLVFSRAVDLAYWATATAENGLTNVHASGTKAGPWASALALGLILGGLVGECVGRRNGKVPGSLEHKREPASGAAWRWKDTRKRRPGPKMRGLTVRASARPSYSSSKGEGGPEPSSWQFRGHARKAWRGTSLS